MACRKHIAASLKTSLVSSACENITVLIFWNVKSI